MTDLKDHWPVEPLSAAATARMIATATATPQLLPWPQTIASAVERALSDWRYAMPYKLAAAAACVILGLGIGLNLSQGDHDVTGLGFMSQAAIPGGEISE